MGKTANWKIYLVNLRLFRTLYFQPRSMGGRSSQPGCHILFSGQVGLPGITINWHLSGSAHDLASFYEKILTQFARAEDILG